MHPIFWDLSSEPCTGHAWHVDTHRQHGTVQRVIQWARGAGDVQGFQVRIAEYATGWTADGQFDDARLAHVKQTKPDAIKARRIPDNNYLTFIDGITKPGARPVEETFDNVVVDTDGEVASVAFDYAFLAEGKQTNWGREMWHLVRVEAGWKIISVIYTIRDPLPK